MTSDFEKFINTTRTIIGDLMESNPQFKAECESFTERVEALATKYKQEGLSEREAYLKALEEVEK